MGETRRVEKREVEVWEERTEKGLYISFHDPANGKELGGRYFAHSNNKPGRPVGGRRTDFFKVYRLNWLAMVKYHHLSFHEVGVFFSLMAFLGWETGYLVNPDTKLPISERELAEKMSVSRAALHQYVNVLEEKGLLAVERGKGGKPNRIFLNDSLLYFGKWATDVKVPEFNGYSAELKIKRRPRPEGTGG